MKIELKIVLVGNINAGKSSIINAIMGKEVVSTSAIGGETKVIHGFEIGAYKLNDGDFSIDIIDTPGLSEAGGKEREKIAIDSAKKGDLILFVINKDLIDIETQIIDQLNQIGKPVIVVFNQIDKYTESQLHEIKKSINSRLRSSIDPENILYISAAPLQKVIIQKADGQEETIERTGLPDIDILKDRIAEISDSLGKHIDWVKENDKQFKTRIKAIEEKATDVNLAYAIAIGAGTAVNPVPLVDLIGGAAGIGTLVQKVAKLYEVDITLKEASKMSKDIIIELAVFSTSAAILLGVGSVLKAIPIVGWLAGGTTQAASVAFYVFLLGEMASEYFANGQSWENNSMKQTLENKVQAIDKKELTHRLKQRILEKIRGQEKSTEAV